MAAVKQATPQQKAVAETSTQKTTAGGDKPITQARRAPPFRIETPSTRKRHLKMLIYGNYGTGKTTLVGTSNSVPSMRDVILIDAESGDLSLDGMEGIDTVRVKDYKTVARVNEFLKAHCTHRDIQNADGSVGNIDKLRELEAMLRGCDVSDIETPRQYHTVLLDSLTEIESQCMYQLLGISDVTKLDEEVQSAEWAEYKKNHAMIQRLVRSFRDLPMHVLITCAQQYTQDENKRQLYTPALTGKLASQVQGFMDVVGYLVVGSADDNGVMPRRLYVQPSAKGKYDAKNRFSAFKGNHFDDPSMLSILTEVGLLPAK
jgi:hypothetical protein